MTSSARLPVYTLNIAAFILSGHSPGLCWALGRAALLPCTRSVLPLRSRTARILKSSILKTNRLPLCSRCRRTAGPLRAGLGLRLLDRTKVFPAASRHGHPGNLCICCGRWRTLPLKDGVAPPIEDSLAGALGRTVEPAIRPLGFNWKIGSASSRPWPPGR
jgi:ferrous iron transport protein B